MNNDYVAMAQKICPVCGITHEHSGEILIDKRLKDIPKDKRITGYGLCEEHDKLFQDGYIALVVADESASTFKDNGNMSIDGAYRTGELIHMRRIVFNDIFDSKLPENQEMVFINTELFAKLKTMHENIA